MGDEGYEIGVGVSDTAAQEDSGYWGLTADSSDAEIWAALTRTMVSVDVKETESAYIYNSTSKGKKLGSVSGLSQGLNLIEDLDNGWSLVEAYRNEDGAFVRGYIRTKTLRTVEPNTHASLLLHAGKAKLLRYSVHCTQADMLRIASQNHFDRIIAYHSDFAPTQKVYEV